MSPSIIFMINIIVFIVCIVLQYMAFHRMAFNRGLFIQVAMFFFTGLVFVAPNAPRVLVWIVFLATWAFTLVMTAYSIRRLSLGKKK
ncbi:hypothetical protein [Tumebacillus lipolyticus]|uniref:Uncharacterized protein n=1 Tax=Tumebacillus lipolyticus TaxID=1280370 RepID=A0ABW4ZXN1_9BACL